MMSGINQASPMSSLLFSRLDTKSQGYLEKSDLATAFSQIADSGKGSASVDDVFTALDSDSDGKVTQDEFSSVLAQLEEQLASSRSRPGHGGPQGAGGMPPPPPPGDDAGFTKEELTSQLESADSSDTARTELISKVVQNFEAADADGDGKVSFQEAMAYDQSTQTATASDSSSGADRAASSEAQVMMKILQLMHAYRNDDSNTASQAATIATVA